ncbi:hypothetical protein SAMN06298216_1009 [Spirosomataceae bacterium TFI 002]|nr:hypothetical protein SAMN06298216_1009 [Spirosomataceae bacterium TFI 002]
MNESIKEFFDGSEGEFITAKEAKLKQDQFLAKSKKEGVEDPYRAEFFGRELLLSLLKKPDAVGIRIYHGLDEENEPRLILTAVNKEKKNIVMDLTALKDMPEGDGDFGANGPRCPLSC